MIYLELQEWFAYFQQCNKKNRLLVQEWITVGIEKKLIPNYVLDFYQRKIQLDKNFVEILQHHDEQLEIGDSDWKMAEYFVSYTPSSWTVTCKDIPKFILWNSKTTCNAHNKEFKGSKMVGFFNERIDDMVQAFVSDNLINGKLYNDKGLRYATNMDYTSRGDASEYALVFKSSMADKTPMFGAKIFTRMDCHRTRYVHVLFTSKQQIFQSNTIASKLKAEKEYHTILTSTKRYIESSAVVEILI